MLTPTTFATNTTSLCSYLRLTLPAYVAVGHYQVETRLVWPVGVHSLTGRKGNPPALGIGIARMLAKRFRVIWTPEYFTSRTCIACGSVCTRCPRVERQRQNGRLGRVREIRGLRQCSNNECGATGMKLGGLFNRDRQGAINIGRNLALALD